MNIINLQYDSTNYYLIQIGDGWVMVDTGWPGTLQKCLNLIRQKNINVTDIKYLITTHFHPDHAGLCQDFKDMGTQLILHHIQVPYLEKLKNFFARKPQYPFKVINTNDNMILSSEQSRIFFKSIGFDGELIVTPGHSNDSISLVIDDCCAFTGDLPGLLFTDIESNQEVGESWQLIQSYRIKTIYPGHGYSFSL